MTENKRYVRILDYSEKEVRIFDEHNQKNIFNIFFEGIDSAICLKGALEDTVDLLNELNHDKNELQERNDRQAKQLDNIYNLIEKQDWETLQGLIEEFKECEEQLKIEMECYDEPTAKRH